MNIGIIGAGMIGETLARRLAQLGHQIAIANSRGPQTLRDLASAVGASAVTALEAARRGEIVVITIPERAVPSCRCRSRRYRPALRQKDRAARPRTMRRKRSSERSPIADGCLALIASECRDGSTRMARRAGVSQPTGNPTTCAKLARAHHDAARSAAYVLPSPAIARRHRDTSDGRVDRRPGAVPRTADLAIVLRRSDARPAGASRMRVISR
jgi:glycine/D-amino acid oxidase-like deaminating enzyme